MGTGPALHGLGDDRPSGADMGCAESGVLAVDIEVAETVSDDAENGVYGVYGEDLGGPSNILALLGGTSGGVAPVVNLFIDDFLANLG